ncbi:DUF6894 family protein [Devosia aurantiaca]|uniref:DUF6894 domain-containing protein n=1 Tax=Devosia aurantiaca TaxID=2714858 RepID=A0A6M1SLM2_9HYPH|nr:hypothetical protein [Devosia aurantiaca]NGP18078.1 hypothetical protein [Devosia aurantiaca]
MPRFFFDTREQDGSVLQDSVGVEFADQQQAFEAARHAVREAVLEMPQRLGTRFDMDVRDEAGRSLGSVGLRFVGGAFADPAAVFLGC